MTSKEWRHKYEKFQQEHRVRHRRSTNIKQKKSWAEQKTVPDDHAVANARVMTIALVFFQKSS